MTSKVKGTEGIEFPDSTVQGSAAYTKAESDAPKPGEILQIVTRSDNGASVSASTWVNLTNALANISPKSANSKLIVECFGSAKVGNVTGVNAQAYFQLYSGPIPTGNFGNYNISQVSSASGGIGIICGATLVGVFNNTDLTDKSFGVAGSPIVGIPNTIGFLQQAFIITEVQN